MDIVVTVEGGVPQSQQGPPSATRSSLGAAAAAAGPQHANNNNNNNNNNLKPTAVAAAAMTHTYTCAACTYEGTLPPGNSVHVCEMCGGALGLPAAVTGAAAPLADDRNAGAKESDGGRGGGGEALEAGPPRAVAFVPRPPQAPPPAPGTFVVESPLRVKGGPGMPKELGTGSPSSADLPQASGGTKNSVTGATANQANKPSVKKKSSNDCACVMMVIGLARWGEAPSCVARD
jgi:hypothetical protein